MQSKFSTEIIFICVFFISSLFFQIGGQCQKKRKFANAGIFLIAISFFLALLPIGFRLSGIDHNTYCEWYRNAEYWLIRKYELTPEPLFALIILFSKYVLKNFQWIYIISGFLFLLGIYKELYRKCDNLFIALFFVEFYIYLYMCGLVRLSIAIGIVSYSYKYLYENNTKKYIIFAIIASLFHYSALISILIYFAYKSKKSISARNVILICIGLFSFNYLFSKFSGRLPYWLFRYGYIGLSGFNISSINSFVVAIPAVILFFCFKKRYLSRNNDGGKLTNLVILSIFLMILSMFYSGTFRFLFYWAPIFAYIYSETPRIIRQNSGSIAFSFGFEIIFMIVGICYILRLFSSPFVGGAIIPFAFNWIF